MSKRFSLNQFERYDLHSQLMDRTCELALSEGLVSEGLLKKFSTGGADESPDNLLHYAMQFRAAPDGEKAHWFARMQRRANLTSQEQEELANLMDLLVPVLNAANSVRESEQPNSNPKEIFKNYFLSGLRSVKDGRNVYDMTPEEWLNAAIESKNNLILSLVNTAHPTNFHTPFGREYERGLIALLKKISISRSGIVKSEDLGAFDIHVRSIAKAIQQGEAVTYLKKVTVGEETATETDVLKVQKQALAVVHDAWNVALADKAVQTAADKIGGDAKAKLEQLKLAAHDRKRAYEQRSWIRAGADKDGRDESTDVIFYAGYKDSLDESGVYRGPILDLRDNAEVRRKTLDVLIAQRYARSPDFAKACDAFCAEYSEPAVAGGEPRKLGEHWTNPRDSVFQLLSHENQSRFLQYLMEKGFDLFNADAVRSEAVGFNEKFYAIYKKLLVEENLDKHTPFWALEDRLRTRLLARLSRVEGDLDLGKGRIQRGGYSYNSVFEPLGPDEDRDPKIIAFNYHHDHFGSPLINNQLTKNGDNSKPVRPMNKEESLSCMSYLRRLFLVNKFLDEQKEKGNGHVVEREQAANFENASDFFAQLYLFQQTGLVKIGDVERGGRKRKEVTEVKIGIQPLFETTPEMLRAPQIIDEILASPLGESYYRARGKAEFMVGYSDGAKSGGNFASHVRIREFERMVTQKFKDKFGEDFEVRILRGPGRGENRGGTRKYDRQYALHHDIVNKSAVSDQTVQGDLTVRMEMDPQFAERTVAEMYVGAVAGAVEARRTQSALEKKRIESFEKACDFIADHSEAYYRQGIFVKEKEADALIKTVIKNPDATSRRQKRSNTEQKGIGPQRAITVEYAANIAALPLHDYGLKHALEEYIAKGPPVLDEHGNEVQGEKALQILARDSDFFREEMKLAVLRQQSFNPVIADLWAKRAGQEAFVDDIKQELTGLGDLCQSILCGKKVYFGSREDYSGEPFTPALADVAQAVLSVHPELSDSMTGKKLYLALQAPVSERPAGPMRSDIPGHSAINNGIFL